MTSHLLALVGLVATIAFFWAWGADRYGIMALAFFVDCVAVVFVRRSTAHPASKTDHHDART